ncbi:DUF1501 domain-containing protein [Aggregatimonas sangjinii]|uniref:DUF1501 domain-containing protein n=1 Tax=Aggregatimonas sangjinii TaxID=2583587 RepID=A0A5B7SQK3_9FLAO|nr:DUF1501 domain-containing protein [Aggregatimonas sangjinii]QCW99219.1 DUF1501 domain-containing protein [Aggregatimonas sangjinii]
MKRRAFIRNSSLASSTLLIPSFIKAFDGTPSFLTGHKKLVIIQLSGGNDGLNTLVPFNNDVYIKNRSTIAQKKTQLLSVTDELGFHESLKDFKTLYDNGYVSVMHNVGYPNPSRSHFRSTDIWHTASASDEYLQTGWVGRYLEKVSKNPLGAIEVDDTLSLLMKGVDINGIATKDAKLFYRTTQDPYFSNVLSQHSDTHLSEHNLGYLFKTALDAKSSAKYLYEKTKTYESAADYPKNAFGKQLKTISEFINSGLETQVYYASLGGFDTHANQVNAQKRLLAVYSKGIATFMKDLKDTGALKDTVVLTFSEFGRRLKQNAANGTDHGAANLVFLMGDDLKHKGMYNTPANLVDLDANGDIKYEVDFRDIYASLLKEWLQTEPSQILNGDFKTLGLV